jgi:large subunit ribosomal protein L3
MKGIVGKEAGHDAVFDPETGVVTPVTVIEAEPCPGRAGEDAGRGRLRRRCRSPTTRSRPQVSKAELGHLKKNNAGGAFRHLAEIRGVRELAVGDSVTVETFERAIRSRSPRSRSARASPGRSSGTTSAAAPSPRLAQHPQAGLDRRLGDAVARFQRASGWRAAWAASVSSQVGLRVHSVEPEQNLILIKGSVPGPKNAWVEIREEKAHTATTTVKRRCWAGRRRAWSSMPRSRSGGQAAPGPRGGEGRAERAARGDSRCQEPWPRRRRPREAVAPEGKRAARARGRFAHRSSWAAALRFRRPLEASMSR